MKELASKIDHTILKPTTTPKQIRQLCGEAMEHGFAAVCVPPTYVSMASDLVSDPVKVCTVVGFPFGYNGTISKLATIDHAIKEGADELDVVINLAKVKSEDWDYLHEEIAILTQATVTRAGKVIKLILETAYLTDDELAQLCNLCNLYHVSYAKTSTGYAPAGAHVDTVKRMRSLLHESIKIKASGGIRSREDAIAMIEAGADRIGASSSVSLVS